MSRTITLLGNTMTEHDISCPDCNAPMVLQDFNGKPIYRCSRKSCRATHSACSDGSPRGVPAPWPVREKRKKAHEVFDKLWQQNGNPGRMDRATAYQWLSTRMNMTPFDAHISRFDASQCERVVALVRAEFGIEPEPELGGGRVGFYDLGF